jgi:molybdenum cofactor cytidylyltransferase
MVKVSAILLAAGESKRMGVDKLSLPWGEKTLLEHCLETLIYSNVKEVVVVLGDRTKEMKSQLKGHKVKVVMNPHSRRGMSTSIRRGLRTIDPDSHGILITMGDLPFLKTGTINSLIHSFTQAKGGIIVPSFRGRKGHPVIFHKRYKKELLKLEGSFGGRIIIEKHPKDVCVVQVKSEGVVKDIDTWKDYKKELRICKR